MNSVKPLLLQGAFFAALYSGARALRVMAQTPLHPAVQARETIRSHAGLATALTQLAKIGDGAALDSILDKVCLVLRYDASDQLDAQWHICRLSSDIVREAKALCTSSSVLTTDELFRDARNCEEEAVPQIETHLDDILHNHLIARAPRS